MISIFRIGRSVMTELRSDMRCFNMLNHYNSDVFTTYGQDQDIIDGMSGHVLDSFINDQRGKDVRHNVNSMDVRAISA